MIMTITKAFIYRPTDGQMIDLPIVPPKEQVKIDLPIVPPKEQVKITTPKKPSVVRKNAVKELDLIKLEQMMIELKPWRQIGAAFGVTAEQARYYALRHLGQHKNKGYTDLDLVADQFKAVYEQGLSWREISKTLGITIDSARYRAKALGLLPKGNKKND
jgi:transposase